MSATQRALLMKALRELRREGGFYWWEQEIVVALSDPHATPSSASCVINLLHARLKRGE